MDPTQRPQTRQATSFLELVSENLFSHKTLEKMKKTMSRLDALLSDTREVVQRNTRLLLIVASQAFFSVIGAIVKILHKVDPLMQVPLKFQYQLLPQYPDLPHELFTIRMITTYIIYMCVRSRMLLRLEFTSLNRFIVKIPDLYCTKSINSPPPVTCDCGGEILVSPY